MRRILIAVGLIVGAVALLAAAFVAAVTVLPDFGIIVFGGGLGDSAADEGRLFADPRKAFWARSRAFDGTVGSVNFFELEPGFELYRVQLSDGGTLDLVVNGNSKVRWPGRRDSVAWIEAADPDTPPSRSAEEAVGLKIHGTYRIIGVGSPLDLRPQAIMLEGDVGGK